MSDTQYKRKIKPGAIELDPEEPVIIVNFDTLELDTTKTDSEGNPVVVSRKSEAKRMRLKTFTSKSAVQRFAEGIVEKCKYIHPSKVPHVAGLLEQLKARLLKQESGEAEPAEEEEEAPQPAPSERPKRPPSAARSRGEREKDTESHRDKEREQEKREQEKREREKEREKERAEREKDREKEREKERKKERERSPEPEREKPKEKVRAKEKDREQPERESEERELEKQQLQQDKELKRLQDEEKRREVDDKKKHAHETALRKKIEQEMEAKYQDEQKIQEALIQAEKDKATAALAEAKKAQDKAMAIAAKAMEEAQKAVRAQLLEEEKENKASKTGKGGKGGKGAKNKGLKQKGKLMMKQNKKNKKLVKEEKASMDNIDSYLERLYEEAIDEKIKGTSLMLQLVQDPVNLEYFIQNDTLLGALSRILAEERKKSTDLITNILQIFFCFSSFSQLHPILLHNKIGDTTMRIVKLEIDRYKARCQDDKFDKDEKKKAKYLQKQERLLFVCFYILLNLAEDTAVELKMKNRDIIMYLVKMLGRKNSDRKFLDELHLLIVTFLKKLSIFAENKAQMVKLGIVKYLRPFLEVREQAGVNEDLLEAVLRLIYNLSFDPDHREEMINQTMIPMIVNTMKIPICKQVSVRILYNVSMDFRHKEICHGALTSAVPMTTQFVIQCPNELIDQELIALAINLANDPKNIDLMVAGDGLHHMVRRVHLYHDPLLIKLLKNISSHEHYKKLFVPYLVEFVDTTIKTTNYDFLLESLSILANLNCRDVRFAEIPSGNLLLDFLQKYMVPGFAEDDVLLAVVMTVGTLATDTAMAPQLAQNRLVNKLHDVLNEKNEDVDIVLQLVYAIFKMLLHQQSRNSVIKHHNFTNCLLDLVIDPNEQVRNLANLSLDIIMEHDEGWRTKIREKRFEMCNREWIDFIQNGGVPQFERDQANADHMYDDQQYGYMDSPQGGGV